MKKLLFLCSIGVCYEIEIENPERDFPVLKNVYCQQYDTLGEIEAQTLGVWLVKFWHSIPFQIEISSILNSKEVKVKISEMKPVLLVEKTI